MLRNTIIETTLLAMTLALAALGCGDDGGGMDTSTDTGTDSGSDTGMDGATDSGADTGTPVDSGTDSSTDGSMDASMDAMADAGLDIEIRGTVYGEGAGDREPDAGVTPWPDGGMGPDGSVITPGGRIVGAAVRLLTLDGATISSTITDGIGEYVLPAPADTLTFLHVEPVTGYAGSLRAEPTRGASYDAYDMVLADEAGIDRVAEDAGITRDPSRGWIACGFNPVDNMAGGDGAELGAGITHDPAFNITDVGVIIGNRLAPLCEAGGGNPPGALPGATCTSDDRAQQVFFPNVLETMVPVTPLDPASGTCAIRDGIGTWITAPGTLTVINIDCAP